MRVAGVVKGISILAAVAAAMMTMAASSVPAQARDGVNGALLGGAAAGVVGGLAVGAILNGNRAPAPVYADEEPVYAAPRARYVPACHMERRKVWLNQDEYTYKKVEVCD